MRRFRSLKFLCFILCLAFSSPLLAQGVEDVFEIHPFVGGSFFQNKRIDLPGRNTRMKVGNGGVIGIRLTENIWEYVGIEESFSYAVGNVRFLNAPPFGNEVSFRNRLWQFYVDPIVYLTPRGSRIRPYLTAGPGVTAYRPRPKSKRLAEDPVRPLFGTPLRLDNSIKFVFNYGAGIKARVTEHLGVRVDVRGFTSQIPRFGIPRTGPPNTLVIPTSNFLNSLQVTAGFTVDFGSEALDKVGGPPTEIHFFGGGSFFKPKRFTLPGGRVMKMKIGNGGVFGFRITENFWEYVGIEESFSYGVGNVRFKNAPGVFGNEASFHGRLWQFYLDPVVHFTPRDSRLRPYVSAGLGFTRYQPIHESRVSARSTVNPTFGIPINIDRSTKVVFNYGSGFKGRLTDHFGIRFDVRGFASQTPLFGIPKTGPPNTITLPHGGALHSLQVTGGGTLYLGAVCPPIVHTFTVPPQIDVSGPTALCPGESTKLSITPQDTIASHRATFRWSVNDKPADVTTPEFTFTAPREAGSYKISVHAEDDTTPSTDKCEIKATRKNPSQPADRTTTVQVKEYKPPTANCSAVGPTEIARGERTRARVTATGSECSGRLTYRWTASEGQITSGADAAEAEFDSTNVSFPSGPPGQQQRKSVTLTATVTDEKGGTANCAVNVTVTFTPQPPPRPEAVRLDDILFAQGSARVNNCGKRILADELYPQMIRNRDYDIILIGHIDPSEQRPARRARRGRAPAELDRERVINTAAFLTAATETCKDIEPARIKVDWVGTDQTSDFRSRFCETATQRRGERRGQAVLESDPRAKNRRVEIWLVPKGAELPKAVKAIKDAPTDEIRAKGCPK